MPYVSIEKIKKILEKNHNNTGHHVFKNGVEIWYSNGKIHRADGPAIIESPETEFWYNNGCHHREDGPAWIDKNLYRWYLNNILYLIDYRIRTNERHIDDGSLIKYVTPVPEYRINNSWCSEIRCGIIFKNIKDTCYYIRPLKYNQIDKIFWFNIKKVL
jgi:hypothetical protein